MKLKYISNKALFGFALSRNLQRYVVASDFQRRQYFAPGFAVNGVSLGQRNLSLKVPFAFDMSLKPLSLKHFRITCG